MAKEPEKGSEEKQQETPEQKAMSEALQKMAEAGQTPEKSQEQKASDEGNYWAGGKYWTHNPEAVKRYGGHNAKVGMGRGIARKERAIELGLPEDSDYETIRVARAKQFGLPETSSWDEINTVVKEAKEKERKG